MRTEDGLRADQWSYNVPVPAGAIYTAHVSLLQARISAPFSGNLTVQLDNGASLAIPVSGVYQGVTYAPAVSHPWHIITCLSHHPLRCFEVVTGLAARGPSQTQPLPD